MLKKGSKTLMVVLVLIMILVVSLVFSKDSLTLKQFIVFGIEQFQSNIKTDDDNININLPIYEKETNGEKGHPGYCFIGDTDGTRHCVELETDDKCVSGQIYSSKEICVNPELRS